MNNTKSAVNKADSGRGVRYDVKKSDDVRTEFFIIRFYRLSAFRFYFVVSLLNVFQKSVPQVVFAYHLRTVFAGEEPVLAHLLDFQVVFVH